MRSAEKTSCLVAAAAAITIGLAAAGTSVVFAQSTSSGSASDCHDEQGLTYLCGFVVPEDVVNVGSTGLVLASGHRAPGNMYLIDPETGASLGSKTP